MNKLRILIAVLVSLCVVAGFSATSFAHGPRVITLDFDSALHLLTVDVDHSVTDSAKHFVNKIEVFLNDSLVITQDMMQQLSRTTQKVSYIIIDAASGDVVRVKATCNMFGSKEASIAIP